MVAVVILTAGLTALAHLTASAVRATTVARLFEAGHASLGFVVDSLQRDGAPGAGRRSFSGVLGAAAEAPLTVEWSIPDDPGWRGSAWLVHPAVERSVEVAFVTRAPW